ncbi:MAG: hypothetical protein LBQ77_07585 [Treponema sp.]|nr:hypothetical protein [Treponema sp.]
MADIFPDREADFLEWLKNFGGVLSNNASSWVVSTSTVSNLLAAITAYETVYEAAKGENGTRALIIEKNEKRNALKADVRAIKNKYLDHNDAVSDSDRERLGLSRRDRTPTPKPRPTSRPILEIVPTNNRQHTATALNQTTGRKTKPSDAHGVRFVSEIRDEPPANAEDLRYSVFRRKVIEVFDYPEENRGKKVFYAACYENAKGETGPWSDIIEAIIP